MSEQKTPWTHRDVGRANGDVEILDAEGKRVLLLSRYRADRVPFIVRAVNAHDALLLVLRLSQAMNERQHAGLEIPAVWWSDLYSTTNEANAALKLAEGEGVCPNCQNVGVNGRHAVGCPVGFAAASPTGGERRSK